jgi:DNA-binding NarL/FixJ family response regulator
MNDQQSNPLTPRHMEILRLKAEGYSDKDVGTALGIAPGTVKNHLHEIKLRLGRRTTMEAVVWLIRRYPDGVTHE